MTTLFIAPVTLLSIASVWAAYTHRTDTRADSMRGDVGQCVKAMLRDANHPLAKWWLPPAADQPVAHVRWYTSLVMHARGDVTTAALPLLPAPSSLHDPGIAVDTCTVAVNAVGAVVLAYTAMNADVPIPALRSTVAFLVPRDSPPMRTLFFTGFVANRLYARPTVVHRYEAMMWTRLLVDAVANRHDAEALVHTLVGVFREEMARSVDMIGKLAYALDIASVGGGTDTGATGYCICTCSVAFLAVVKAVVFTPTVSAACEWRCRSGTQSTF